jgi:3D (Asp-Asp-Asp) domain-containing protein
MKIKLRPFIKRGLEVFIMMMFVFFLTNTNEFDKSVFDFGKLNKEVGFVAYAVKNEESKPKPVEKNVVFKKKEPVTPKSYETNNGVAVSNNGELSGSLTGYAADCPACSGRLACTNYNVYKNGVVTYSDATYGNVRIVASSRNIPCGSIVAINSSLTSQPMLAIVLDRGVSGNNLDLLVATEAEAIKNIGRKKVTFSILRSGW